MSVNERPYELGPEEEAAMHELFFECLRAGYLEVVGQDERGRTMHRGTEKLCWRAPG